MSNDPLYKPLNLDISAEPVGVQKAFEKGVEVISRLIESNILERVHTPKFDPIYITRDNWQEYWDKFVWYCFENDSETDARSWRKGRLTGFYTTENQPCCSFIGAVKKAALWHPVLQTEPLTK